MKRQQKRGLLGPIVYVTAIASQSFPCLGVNVECAIAENGEIVIDQRSGDRLFAAVSAAPDPTAAYEALERHKNAVNEWAAGIRARLSPGSSMRH